MTNIGTLIRNNNNRGISTLGLQRKLPTEYDIQQRALGSLFPQIFGRNAAQPFQNFLPTQQAQGTASPQLGLGGLLGGLFGRGVLGGGGGFGGGFGRQMDDSQREFPNGKVKARRGGAFALSDDEIANRDKRAAQQQSSGLNLLGLQDIMAIFQAFEAFKAQGNAGTDPPTET